MGWPGKGRFRLFRGQRGFTLLETLIAVFLLGLIGTGVLSAFNTNSKAISTLDEQVVAANLATAYFEAIRAVTYDNTLEYSSIGDNITIPSDYRVDINVDYSDDGIAWVYPHSTANQTLQRIIVSVSRQGKPLLSVCTWRAERL